MRATINRKGTIIIQDAPQAMGIILRKWFRTKQIDDRTHLCPEKKIRALLNRYPNIEIDPKLLSWIDGRFSRNEIMRRISPHLKTYRGGYQAKIVSRAIDRRRLAIFCGYGGGKSTMFLEIAHQTGPTLLVVPPFAWESAYMSRVKGKDGNPEGDYWRWYQKKLRLADCVGAIGEEKRMALLDIEADLYAINPENLYSALDAIHRLPLATLEIDESVILAGYDSRVAKACSIVSQQVTNVVIGSAFPAPEGLKDLYPQVELIEPGYLGKYRDFCSTYGDTEFNPNAPEGSKCYEVLDRIQSDGLAILLKQDTFWPEGKDLQPDSYERVPVELNEQERKYYQALLEDNRLSIEEKDIHTSGGMNKIMKQRQVTSGFIYTSPHGGAASAKMLSKRPSKMLALGKLIRKHIKKEQFIVWCHFQREYQMVAKLLDHLGISHGLLKGSGRSRRVRRLLQRFRNGKVQAIISNPQSAAHGVRMENCRNSVYVSHDYSVNHFEQSIRRTLRPGQTRKVRVWMLVATGTVDENIVDCLEGKTHWHQLVERVLNSEDLIKQEKLDERYERRKRARNQHSGSASKGPRDRGNRRRSDRSVPDRRGVRASNVRRKRHPDSKDRPRDRRA